MGPEKVRAFAEAEHELVDRKRNVTLGQGTPERPLTYEEREAWFKSLGARCESLEHTTDADFSSWSRLSKVCVEIGLDPDSKHEAYGLTLILAWDYGTHDVDEGETLKSLKATWNSYRIGEVWSERLTRDSLDSQNGEATDLTLALLDESIKAAEEASGIVIANF